MITIALPNIAEFQASMRESADQVPFALSRTVRELLLRTQLAARNHTGEIFHGKQGGWVAASVKIVKFPTKYEGDTWGQIGIHPPGGDQKADILTKFETEEVKLPHLGSHVVVPAGINEGKALRDGQRFRDFHFVQHGGTWRDDARQAYMVRLSAEKLAVFQRVDHRTRYKRHGKTRSAAAGGSVLLFFLFPSVPITPNLEFAVTAQRIVDTGFESVFSFELDAALASRY